MRLSQQDLSPAVPLVGHGVALVTGAARGIGAAVLSACARAGYRAVGVDRDGPALAATTRALAAEVAAPVLGLTADLRDRQAVDALVARVEDEVGPVDALASVAGILKAAPIVELEDEAWDETVAVNLTGTFRVCRAIARRMVSRRRGVIVTVSSNAATVPRARLAAYCAAKAGVTTFTRCLGLELAPLGIRCNVVSPGSTDTDMLRMAFAGGQGPRTAIEGDLASFRLGIPLGRIASPAQVAEAVLFLLSERASHITMHDLRVDGGAALGA
jgi:2,3-dihydro-2,3-dihydroxybenzoate dehydrogenase